MEWYIIKRNTYDLNYADGTTCIIEPLNILLGTNSFTEFGKEMFLATLDLDQFPHIYLQKLYLRVFKKESVNI